jgi:hypothetical protein
LGAVKDQKLPLYAPHLFAQQSAAELDITPDRQAQPLL